MLVYQRVTHLKTTFPKDSSLVLDAADAVELTCSRRRLAMATDQNMVYLSGNFVGILGIQR